MLGLRTSTKKIRRLLAGWLVVLITRFVTSLSEAQAKRIASVLGQLLFRISRASRQQIQENLRLVYGDSMTDNERFKMSQESSKNLATMAIEAMRLPLLTPEEVWEKIDDNGVVSTLKECLEKGRNVMIITGHYGNWELFAAYISQIAPLTVLARRNDNDHIEEIIRRIRASHKVRILDRSDSGAPREMLRMGKEGGHILGILMDQDTTRIQGVFSEFMGIPALTPSGPASIAIRDDFDLFVIVLKPIGNGKHKLIARGPIMAPLDGSREQRILSLTNLFNHHLSEVILDDPQYWVWNHRRWRRKPDSGESA